MVEVHTIVKYVNDMKYDEGTNPSGILVYDDTEDGFKWYGNWCDKRNCNHYRNDSGWYSEQKL